MFKKLTFALAIVVAFAAPSASADNGKTPPFAQSNGKVAQPAPTPPAAHHGLRIRLKLNSIVTDGGASAFSVVVEKTAGTPVSFASIAIGWSFDGAPPKNMATLSELPASIRFVDPDRNWIRIGSGLSKGQNFQLTGKVAVADRTQQKGNHTFFCIQVVVRSTIPGEPNATWDELSSLRCSQYSVS